MKSLICILAAGLLSTLAMADDKPAQPSTSNNNTPVVHVDKQSDNKDKNQSQNASSERASTVEEQHRHSCPASSDNNDRSHWPSMPSGYY